MKYLVIAYDERQYPFDTQEPLNLYDYLRNELDNDGIVAGMVECESLQEVMGSTDWFQVIYNDMMERAGA